MEKACFFVKSSCLGNEDCAFWDTSRNVCDLKSRVNIDTATNGKIILNDSTFTKIVNSNSSRNGLILCNIAKEGDDKNVYVSLSSVEDAVDGTGYNLKDAKIWPVPKGYIGEVCGKSELNNPIITFVEW